MNQQGFSLVDLLLCLALIGLLSQWALPSMSQLYHRHRADDYLRSQQQLLNLGRSLANSTGSQMTLCPSPDGQRCQTDWQLPQLLFQDRNRNGQRESHESQWSHQALLKSGQQLSWQGFRGNSQILIVPIGGGYQQNGTFLFCDNSDPRFGRSLIVQRNGRNRAGTDSNQNGIVEDANGQDIRCPL